MSRFEIFSISIKDDFSTKKKWICHEITKDATFETEHRTKKEAVEAKKEAISFNKVNLDAQLTELQ